MNRVLTAIASTAVWSSLLAMAAFALLPSGDSNPNAVLT